LFCLLIFPFTFLTLHNSNYNQHVNDQLFAKSEKIVCFDDTNSLAQEMLIVLLTI